MKHLFTNIIFLLLASCLALSAQTQGGKSSIIDAYEQKNSSVAISTNALYDAFLIPNLGLEVKVHDNWTIAANGMWAWWTFETRHVYWRIYGGDLAVRRYFGKQSKKNRSMTGHHTGLYGQVLSYDFQLGNFGRMSPTLSYAAGVEYGYSFPVANSLNIDCTVGVGYLGGYFDDYVKMDDHNVWKATVKQMWFGPTKASISLVWLLGSK